MLGLGLGVWGFAEVGFRGVGVGVEVNCWRGRGAFCEWREKVFMESRDR